MRLVVASRAHQVTPIRLVWNARSAPSGHHPGVLVISWEGSTRMADLAFAALLIGIFVVLALTLRGLERL
jgi:hypothetical protein